VPVSRRRTFCHPLPARGSAIAPRHLRGRAAFILEYQLVRIDLAYRRPPRLTTALDRKRVLFLGVE
jgi:hypothetical protein